MATWRKNAVGKGYIYNPRGPYKVQVYQESYTTYQGSGKPVYHWDITYEGYKRVGFGTNTVSLEKAKSDALAKLAELQAT